MLENAGCCWRTFYFNRNLISVMIPGSFLQSGRDQRKGEKTYLCVWELKVIWFGSDKRPRARWCGNEDLGEADRSSGSEVSSSKEQSQAEASQEGPQRPMIIYDRERATQLPKWPGDLQCLSLQRWCLLSLH